MEPCIFTHCADSDRERCNLKQRAIVDVGYTINSGICMFTGGCFDVPGKLANVSVRTIPGVPHFT